MTSPKCPPPAAGPPAEGGPLPEFETGCPPTADKKCTTGGLKPASFASFSSFLATRIAVRSRYNTDSSVTRAEVPSGMVSRAVTRSESSGGKKENGTRPLTRVASTARSTVKAIEITVYRQ